MIIESAKAVVPSQQTRDVARSTSSAQLKRQTARRVPILTVAVLCAVVLVALSTGWYHRENEETVHHYRPRLAVGSPGFSLAADLQSVRPGSLSTRRRRLEMSCGTGRLKLPSIQ
jgi:hypothetical protein